MSENSINLLKSKQTGRREREEKLLRMLRIASGISLFIVSFFALVLFILNKTSTLPNLKSQEASYVLNLSSFNTKRAKFLLAEKRVQEIAGILDKRFRFDDAVSTILQKVPADISIKTFALSRKNVTMTMSSSSLRSIDMLLESFAAMTEKKDLFSKITLDGLSADPKSGQYTISLQANLL